MKFRTPIETPRGLTPIEHSEPILMLGSCFTSEVGDRLQRDGFNAVVNPMGVLYNPASIAKVVNRALCDKPYTINDLTCHEGVYHCLDYPSTYQDHNPSKLLERVNGDFAALVKAVNNCTTWIITLGTSYIFQLPDGTVVGNCHKLPASMFTRRRMQVDEIISLWAPLATGRRIIFTVSPIRHTADGLHGNQLSKATLLLASDHIPNAEYFPAYEALIDDLRDYRFYDSDMKHPSPVAVDYIYELFGDTYFTPATKAEALECCKKALRSAHRPIL